MNRHALMFADPPELTDKNAAEILDFLYEIITAFENQYANQLRRHYQSAELPQPDLFEDFDDQLPTS